MDYMWPRVKVKLATLVEGNLPHWSVGEGTTPLPGLLYLPLILTL